MEEQKTVVFNIQRFSINDGPGIRTTVFLKGCMLNCVWCHNPESKFPYPQLMFYEKKCIRCGKCVISCPKKLHSINIEGRHFIDRTGCIACGKCVEACVGALEICGKEMGVEEVLEEVIKDKDFYENSGGGMTLSGGEPLMCSEFTLKLLKRAKELGIHTCIETSGFAKWKDIEKLIPYVDLFLWDIKESDSKKHQQYTGVSNELILNNLRKINAIGAKIILRCPIIPGLNDRIEHFQAIASLADELINVQWVEVEPYHPLGISKSESLGVEYFLKEKSFPNEEMIGQWISAIALCTAKPVRKA